eukprot:383530-Hanusia_phi.AAC.2
MAKAHIGRRKALTLGAEMNRIIPIKASSAKKQACTTFNPTIADNSRVTSMMRPGIQTIAVRIKNAIHNGAVKNAMVAGR